MHYPGHAHDYMYFAVPLRGNFDFSCELSRLGRREGAHISYGGLRLAIEEDLKTLELAHYNRPIRKETIDPPLTGIAADGWYAFRLSVRDGNCVFSVNGRTIHEVRVPSEPDPWLAVHVPAENTGGIRKVVISGAPTHPKTLALSSSPDLSGWLAEYYDESVVGDAAGWQKRGEEIYAPRAGAAQTVGRRGAGCAPSRKACCSTTVHCWKTEKSITSSSTTPIKWPSTRRLIGSRFC